MYIVYRIYWEVVSLIAAALYTTPADLMAYHESFAETDKFVYRDTSHLKCRKHSGDLCFGVHLFSDVKEEVFGFLRCQLFMDSYTLRKSCFYILIDNTKKNENL